MTYYAWSKFKAEVNEWGVVGKWIMPGDTITKSDLGVSDDEWKELIEAGAVREDKYPDIAEDVSPAEHWKANPEAQPESTLDETSTSQEVMAAADTGKKLPLGTPAEAPAGTGSTNQ